MFLIFPTDLPGKKKYSKKYTSNRSHNTYSSRKSYVSSRKRLVHYRVKRGDSLYKIARIYKTTVTSIKQLNRLKSNRIYKGQRLKVYKNHYIKKKKSAQSRPYFRWPIYYVRSVKKDTYSGVKPIGILINGPPGAPVRSSAKGQVVRVGRMRGYGKYIVVRHKSRYATVYAKLNRVTVHEGQYLKKGQRLGFMSRDFPQIHFQIDYAGKPQNPLTYLPGRKKS